MKKTRDDSLRSLIKTGLDPKHFPDEKLMRWLAQARLPILACGDHLTNKFIEAMLTGEPLEFIYIGGSTPGSIRRIKVSLVFRHELKGRVYVSGYCLDRAGNRTFALDLIMVVHTRN